MNFPLSQAFDQSILFFNGEQLEGIILSQPDMLEFMIKKGSQLNSFKAWGGNNKEIGHNELLWFGVVGESKETAEANPSGDFSCYAEFDTLTCSYHIFYGDQMSSITFITDGKKLTLEENLMEDEPFDEDNEQEDMIEIKAVAAPLPIAETRFVNSCRTPTNGDIQNSSETFIASTRDLETSQGADRGTDLIVFYTEEAYDGGRNIENKIKMHVNLFNEALRAKNVTNAKAYLNLVSMWGLFKCEYAEWIQNRTTLTALRNFNQELQSIRHLVGADLMMLIHDWDGGYWGMASYGRSHSITDIDYIHEHTFQHEIGHNFGLWHSDANKTIHTLMEQGGKKVNIFSKLSAKSFDLEVNKGRFKHAWNYRASKAVTRVQPLINGKLQSWSYERCSSGIRALGLSHYHDEIGHYDYYILHAYCGLEKRNLSLKNGGGGRKISENTVSCSNSNLIRGVVFYRFRQNNDDQDIYHIGINCSNSSEWQSSITKTEGDFISYDWSANWKVKSDKYLDYIKFNRYREDDGNVDTYSLDVGFDSNFGNDF